MFLFVPYFADPNSREQAPRYWDDISNFWVNERFGLFLVGGEAATYWTDFPPIPLISMKKSALVTSKRPGIKYLEIQHTAAAV